MVAPILPLVFLFLFSAILIYDYNGVVNKYEIDTGVKTNTKKLALNYTIPRDSLVESKEEITSLSRDTLPNGSKTSPHPRLNSMLLDRFIVVPEYKLLFCYVEKVGCTTFNNIFRILRTSHPNVTSNNIETKWLNQSFWLRNTPKHHNMKKADLEELMIDPQWLKAVFYRDPTSRFLSAFRSKCEPGHDDMRPCKMSFGKRKTSFAKALSIVNRNNTSNQGFNSNPHFKPASEFCGGLGNTIDYYDFVHELTPDTSASHIETLLKKIGVNESMVNLLVNAPAREKEGNKGKGKEHTTNANDNLCKYYKTPAWAKIISDNYLVDYELFKMTPKDLT